MRKAVLVLALVALLAPFANAQEKPIYFVVDASGSMAGENKRDAEDLLAGLSLPRDQLVSVTFFGSRPAVAGIDLCNEVLDIPVPSRRGSDFPPSFPELGTQVDETAIRNALDNVLASINGPAKVILITDGKEDCNTDFLAIRTRYPDADILVRQVGGEPDAVLQELESVPAPVPEEAIQPPTNVAVTFETAASVSPLWQDARWAERYFWTLPYVFLALSAWFFGSRYGKAAEYYDSEIAELENLKKSAAEYFIQNNERKDDDWPDFATVETAMDTAAREGKKSFAAFLLFVGSGLPLILLSGATEVWVCLTLLLTPLVLIGIVAIPTAVVALRDKSKAPGPVARFAQVRLPKGVWWNSLLALCIAIIATAHTVVDGESTRGAAWFSLSTGFSAVLAIASSAPLVFAGGQYWKLERTKTAYKSTWDHGIDETQIGRAHV